MNAALVRRLTRALVSFAAATLLTYGFGCSSDHDHGSSSTAGDVIIEGNATDEGLAVLVGATSKPAASPVVLTAPAEGAKLPAATPATFTWTDGKTGLLMQPTAPSRARAPWPLGAERTAQAHGVPMNGFGYYLRIAGGGNDKLVEAFTTNKSYTPSADAWRKITAAGGTVRVTLVYATFEQNRIAPGGGPFEAPAVSFSVVQ